MPFNKKETWRLECLLGKIKQTADPADDAELTFRAVPFLKEVDEIVTSRLKEETPPDRETLTDAVSIVHFLAEAYDRLGRPYVSVSYYERTLALLACLKKEHGEAPKDASGVLYSALKARNYYVDDDCGDLRALSYDVLPAEIVDDVFSTVLARRRNLRHDIVETTKAYQDVIDEVEEEIEGERTSYGFGSCHQVWRLKREALAKRGVVWRTPAMLNPRVRFD